MDKGIVMKYSLLSILIASLFLSACGTDDENNIPNNIPKPEQPQSDANTTVLTLGSNNNIASLSNVVQATFSPQDAKNNPVITIRKAKDKDLVEPFNWAKNVLDIENGSDYEVTLSSSKPLSSPVDMELSVPIELFRSLNDQNALAAYIVTTIDDDDSQQAFVPITSTYNPETQKLLVTLPNGSPQPDSENKFFNVIVKIGLAKAVKAESIIPITATARMLTLPVEGELVLEDPNTFKLICPVKNVVCTETSRFGVRKRGTVGKSDHHRGIDLRATSVNSLIAAGAGTVIGIKKDKDNGSIALRVDGGKSTIVYRHMSEIDSNIKVIDEKNNISGHVAAGTILGKAGKVGVTFEHLHLELNRNDALLVCKGTSAINRTCTTRITAPIDPFPAFVNSLKIVNKSPQGTSVTKDQKFNLELQAFDVNGNRINSEIDNRYSESIKAGKKIIQPQGSLRFVNWSVNPSSAYKIESDAKLIPDDTLKYVTTNKDDPKKRSSASVTVNQEESATITASWDGLDNLKAEYKVNPAYIYDVSPKSAELGQVTKFSINGVGLSDTVSFSLPNCTNVTKLGGTDTRRYFSCIPTSIGEINGIVKGGAEDLGFTVTVLDNTGMEVKLLNGSYYHQRVVSHPSEYVYQVYHSHLLKLKVSGPMYSVVYPRSQYFNLDCGGWKKSSHFAGGCLRTEGDPPTVNMSWKMLTGCGGEGCFPYLIDIAMEQFTDSTQTKTTGQYKHFYSITSPLKVIEFPEVKSENFVEYYNFF